MAIAGTTATYKGLMASGQITMRKVNGWQTLGERIAGPAPIDLAA